MEELFLNQKVISVELEKEMKKSYIDYAMSVIVGRALPDVRDGLKPVHRRILYAMYEDNLTPDKAYRKSATTVGNVLGRYHPHGDAAVYDTMVRMAQDFSLRYPLIDGHGNFGSVDGDGAAAYRYTEARMSKIAMEMLTDIDKETVDWQPNFDDSRKEPVVIPSRFPDLLVNGSSGIAVGMATSIPPHNLKEVSEAVVLLIDNPDAELDEIMEFIQGPDFPTGAMIMGRSGIRQAYATGRGKAVVRAKAEIEEHKEGRFRIVVTEIPYQVNKARLIENIADLVKDKRIEGISDLRDESDRDGMRIVVELKKDANAQVVLNQLYRYTQMQDSFSIILLAIVNGEPKVLTLKECLEHYITFQKEIIVKRTRYDLRKAKERAHILEGLKIALDNIDQIIATIKANRNIPEAKAALMERFNLSDVQSQAIIEMRLGRLTGLERSKIEEEFLAITEKIKDYEDILASEQRVKEIVKTELTAISDKFSDVRRSSIEAVVDDIDYEDLIEEQDCVITLTHFGYIKRLPVDTYHSQRRGGRGVNAMTTREDDFVEELFVASTHSYIMFFTNKGRVFRIKGYMIPEAGRTAKGTNVINLLQIDQDEKVTALIHLKEFTDNSYLTMVTKKGIIKRTAAMDYNTARKGGLNAINLDEGDELVRVKLTDGTQKLIIGTNNGMAIKFDENDAREMGRVTRGVRAIRLTGDDFVVGVSIDKEDADLLSVTENGYAKRTKLNSYRLQGRGGKGITNYNITEKTGKVVGLKVVTEDDDVMLISNDGVIIRTAANEIRQCGRITSGVIVMRLAEGVKVATLARVAKEDEEVIIDEESGEV